MNLPLGLAGRVLTGSGKEYTKTNTKHFTLVCQCKLFVIMCFLDSFLFYMNNKGGGGLKPNRIFPLIVVLQTASFFLEFHLKCKVHVENQYLLEKLKIIAKLCGKEEGGGGGFDLPVLFQFAIEKSDWLSKEKPPSCAQTSFSQIRYRYKISLLS